MRVADNYKDHPASLKDPASPGFHLEASFQLNNTTLHTKHERQNKLDTIFNIACEQLDSGSVAVGEDHNFPEGRSLIADLIVERKVRKLFLEIVDGNKNHGPHLHIGGV